MCGRAVLRGKLPRRGNGTASANALRQAGIFANSKTVSVVETEWAWAGWECEEEVEEVEEGSWGLWILQRFY